MAVYLDTRGKSSLAIGICGRCSQKFPIGELRSDPNYPGLMVCDKDRDDFDPYRLPARQPEDIALRFARPDTPIGTEPNGAITEDNNEFLITEDDEYLFFLEEDEL
jgi:hypothetical protein